MDPAMIDMYETLRIAQGAFSKNTTGFRTHLNNKEARRWR